MRRPVVALALAMTSVFAAAQPAPDLEVLRKQVTETEKAFARSMAERDFAAFARHLSEGTVFYGRNVLRGKAAVMAAWKPFYEGEKAPFSWEPDQVDVLPDGTLAHSSGPVRDENGKRVSRFNSVWRLESPGVWRIVFDKGQPLSEAEKQLP